MNIQIMWNQKDAEAAMESLLERYHQTQKKLQEANLLLSQFQVFFLFFLFFLFFCFLFLFFVV